MLLRRRQTAEKSTGFSPCGPPASLAVVPVTRARPLPLTPSAVERTLSRHKTTVVLAVTAV